MNQEEYNLLQSKNESREIYQTLYNSKSMLDKCFKLECNSIKQCLENTHYVLVNYDLSLTTGSTGEGTHINLDDYGINLHSATPGYISDLDAMFVNCGVQVLDEGDILPERFGNYMYCRAERGEHTTEGFRKLRVIHEPQYYSTRLSTHNIQRSIDYEHLSSSKWLSASESETVYFPLKEDSIQTGKNFNISV